MSQTLLTHLLLSLWTHINSYLTFLPNSRLTKMLVSLAVTLEKGNCNFQVLKQPIKQSFPTQFPEHTSVVPRFWPLAGKFNTNCHICLFFKGGMWCPLLEGTSLGVKATPAPASRKYSTPSLSLSTCCCPQASPPVVHSKQEKASLLVISSLLPPEHCPWSEKSAGEWCRGCNAWKKLFSKVPGFKGSQK